MGFGATIYFVVSLLSALTPGEIDKEFMQRGYSEKLSMLNGQKISKHLDGSRDNMPKNILTSQQKSELQKKVVSLITQNNALVKSLGATNRNIGRGKGSFSFIKTPPRNSAALLFFKPAYPQTIPTRNAEPQISMPTPDPPMEDIPNWTAPSFLRKYRFFGLPSSIETSPSHFFFIGIAVVYFFVWVLYVCRKSRSPPAYSFSRREESAQLHPAEINQPISDPFIAAQNEVLVPGHTLDTALQSAPLFNPNFKTYPPANNPLLQYGAGKPVHHVNQVSKKAETIGMTRKPAEKLAVSLMEYIPSIFSSNYHSGDNRVDTEGIQTGTSIFKTNNPDRPEVAFDTVKGSW